jgi:xylulose-5-phosphate/fructose-6-phosphate phosphoketolase
MDASTIAVELQESNKLTLAPNGEPTLAKEELRKINAYWRAANYLSVGQIYLYDNPLLREPLKLSHVKPLVVSHWGTTPGQNFIYVHLNRVIKKHDLDIIYIAGPGHGGPALVGNVYLEGTWSEIYPNVTQDEAGLKSLFKQFSFPGGISSHVAPTTPGSIHEGGELGYSLSHAFGAAFDNPELIVQVPMLVDQDHPEHVALLENWMKSYKAEELFDASGRLIDELAELAPKGNRRMGANPHANGGILLRDLLMPDFRAHAVHVPSPGAVDGQDTLVLGRFFSDIVKLNPGNFRIFGPDETLSNLLGAVFEATNRQWDAEKLENDEFLAPTGRVLDSMLSEHQCEGWLEGYLLTGRHGLFNSYEAFIRIVDSMFSQHAKWLKVTLELPWRRKIASLNYLLASHVWQQDHNGFTHQDPGFLDHVINKKADIVRVYLPPDANCLLSTFDHCLRSRHYVNVVVAGKHALPQWLTMEEAIVHCTQGLGIWQWASNDQDSEPDVVMACCGDTPTLEILAAVSILREYLPELKIRVINVVDLMKLQSASEHPHGLNETDYDSLFTKDKHIIFGFHGYPSLVHRLTYRRTNRNIHVHGYKEEGTITTAFDMRVQNELDRFHLVQDVVDRLPHLGSKGTYLKQIAQNKLVAHKLYINQHGQDLPEIQNWKWGAAK